MKDCELILTGILENIIQNIKNGHFDIQQQTRLQEILISFLNKQEKSDNELIKYLFLGWYIYSLTEQN